MTEDHSQLRESSMCLQTGKVHGEAVKEDRGTEIQSSKTQQPRCTNDLLAPGREGTQRQGEEWHNQETTRGGQKREGKNLIMRQGRTKAFNIR